MMVETYLRRGKRTLQRLMLDPKVRSAGAVAAYGGSGFLLSAASLAGYPQPLSVGLICAATGWRALLLSLGAMAGYPTFWGQAGLQGIVWSAAGGLLALLVGKKEESREQPLMIPALTAFLTGVTGLSFYLILDDRTPPLIFLLRIALTFFSGALFTQGARCRDAMTGWLSGGVAALALGRLWLTEHLNLGCIAAGILAVGAPFPAAALAGVGLDLAKTTALPMTAVVCLAYFVRMIPFDRRWQHYAAPGLACLGVMAACGIWDMGPLPGLALGGALGAFLPPRPQIYHRRGETGAAQVRLEISAQLLRSMEQLILEWDAPPVDEGALLEKVRLRACEGCSARQNCQQRLHLTPAMLQQPLEADCRKQGRLIPELRRAGEQRKAMVADHKRREEYRHALAQQYCFLGRYLRNLADSLPRSAKQPQVEFKIEVSARTRGKEQANGDRCTAFSGGDSRYYVLLCDGMGTGLGAAREGQEAADLLKKMLTAGFPPEQALSSVNSLLALQGRAGAVTMDLARIQLDTGLAHIYKWGAAPSWVLTRGKAEKIGTATPPPGISVTEKWHGHKLSLRRGEVLVLLSDGVDGEGIPHRKDLSADLPPGELAAKLLEGSREEAEDDATAAVIRLRPVGAAPS